MLTFEFYVIFLQHKILSFYFFKPFKNVKIVLSSCAIRLWANLVHGTWLADP